MKCSVVLAFVLAVLGADTAHAAALNAQKTLVSSPSWSWPHPVSLDNAHHVVKRSLDQPLRIKVFFHDSVDKLEDQDRSIIKDKVVPDAVSFWSSVLKVRANMATIRLNRKCENNQYFLAPGDPTQFCRNKCETTMCGEAQVPKDHLAACHTCNEDGLDCKEVEEAGSGIDGADFVLYVSALQTPQCQESIGGAASTVAYAAHCQQESALDRPVAGHTNVCPSALHESPSGGPRMPEIIESLTATVKHELLHALGFSSSLFAFYRDKDGQPLTERGADGKPPINDQLQLRQWSDKVVKEVVRPWKVRSGMLDRSFHVMVTPRVADETRKHFNCSLMEGAELEDQGGDGTALTHWEKRIFQNEAMTGTVHTQNPAYSRVTFALMEDSGWYLPDYSMAEELEWGKNAGCDFAMLSCMELMQKKESSAPFCSSLMQSATASTSCTSDGTAVGSCNLVVYDEPLPEKYQNFDAVEGVNAEDVSKVGSSVTLADFCPYVQQFTWRSTSSSSERGSDCVDPFNQPGDDDNFALEYYGNNARCFRQGRKWEQRSCRMLKQWKRYGAGCYAFTCSSGRLNVVVRNVTFACDKPGQEIDVSLMQGDWLHQGSVVCPPCSEFCSDCSNSTLTADAYSSLQEENAAKGEDIAARCRSDDEGYNTIRNFFHGFGINLR